MNGIIIWIWLGFVLGRGWLHLDNFKKDWQRWPILLSIFTFLALIVALAVLLPGNK